MQILSKLNGNKNLSGYSVYQLDGVKIKVCFINISI